MREWKSLCEIKNWFNWFIIISEVQTMTSLTLKNLPFSSTNRARTLLSQTIARKVFGEFLNGKLRTFSNWIISDYIWWWQQQFQPETRQTQGFQPDQTSSPSPILYQQHAVCLCFKATGNKFKRELLCFRRKKFFVSLNLYMV